jgi:hypothetical protein
MKNGVLLSNKVFFIKIIELLVCICINAQLWVNCVFMVYIYCFIFKAQNFTYDKG